MRHPMWRLGLSIIGLVFLGSSAFAQIVVHVEDTHGEPVPSFPLTLRTRPASVGAAALSVDSILDRTLTDARGCAQLEIPESTPLTQSTRFFVRAGTIEQTPREIEIDPMVETDVTLVLPPCGEVVLMAPDGVSGSLAIRAEPLESGRGWPSNSSDDVRIESEQVHFPWVALDLTLQYRFSEGSAEPSTETFEGPNLEGDVVSLVVRRVHETVLRGRLFDETMTTLADADVAFSLSLPSSKPSSHLFGRFETNRLGFFRHVFAIAPSVKDESFLLDLQTDCRDASGMPRLIALRLPLESSLLAPGTTDLGDLVVAPPDSPAYAATLSDQDLEATYVSSLEGFSSSQPEWCLLEMARRGSPRWLSFLTRELERISEERALRRFRPDRRDVDGPPANEFDVDYLTILRRAQRRPDPVALVVDPSSTLRVTFPESPIVVCRLENQDDENANIVVQEGGDYRSGRFERCHVIATNEVGTLLPHLPSPCMFGGGFSRIRSLQRGESIEFSIPLGSYADFSGLGRYRTEIVYRNQGDDIFRRNDSLVAGICYRTEPFDIEVLPRRIRLSRAEAATIERWIDALDVWEPVLILTPQLSVGKVGTDIEDPVKGLLRAGYKAIPVLVDRLEVEGSSALRAWIYAMLWNLTGLSNPDQVHRAALGDIRYASSYKVAKGHTRIFGYETREGEIHLRAQEELTDEWLRRRRSFEVVWTD